MKLSKRELHLSCKLMLGKKEAENNLTLKYWLRIDTFLVLLLVLLPNMLVLIHSQGKEKYYENYQSK